MPPLAELGRAFKVPVFRQQRASNSKAVVLQEIRVRAAEVVHHERFGQLDAPVDRRGRRWGRHGRGHARDSLRMTAGDVSRAIYLRRAGRRAAGKLA